MLHASYHAQKFHFVFDARTSRGAMKSKTSWFFKVWDDEDPEVAGIGECSPLPGLSMEHKNVTRYLDILVETINKNDSFRAILDKLEDHRWMVDLLKVQPSSVAMAFEMALRDFQFGGKKIIYENSAFFQQPIPINGLIWMGDREFMAAQIEKKIALGFDCLKLKVGGHDFATELEILSWIRSHFSHKKLTLRLDANGAFDISNVFEKLEALAKYDIHSIEDPVSVFEKRWSTVCEKSPIPVAVDDMLIAMKDDMQDRCLDVIKPKYIVLKPSLHGGFSLCREWIKKAERRKIGWRITSALESNLGLNAIAQFAGAYSPSSHQGLGTGELYSDNFESPLSVRDGKLFYDSNREWRMINGEWGGSLNKPDFR